MGKSISSLLKATTEQLAQAKSTTPRLDAEVLLAYVLKVDRSWLAAHPEFIPKDQRLRQFDQFVAQRSQLVPIAYILGHKEFYRRDFSVTPDVLIPRPESESVIDLLKEYLSSNPKPAKLVDVGTGSGCLGITAKLELPTLDVTLADISSKALEVAKQNAGQLYANVRVVKSDLLADCEGKFDVVIANLPYVDSSWPVSPELAHEPDLALFADDYGLELIYKLLDQIPEKANQNSLIILEADPRQHQKIAERATKNRLRVVEDRDFIIAFQLG